MRRQGTRTPGTWYQCAVVFVSVLTLTLQLDSCAIARASFFANYFQRSSGQAVVSGQVTGVSPSPRPGICLQIYHTPGSAIPSCTSNGLRGKAVATGVSSPFLPLAQAFIYYLSCTIVHRVQRSPLSAIANVTSDFCALVRYLLATEEDPANIYRLV